HMTDEEMRSLNTANEDSAPMAARPSCWPRSHWIDSSAGRATTSRGRQRRRNSSLDTNPRAHTTWASTSPDRATASLDRTPDRPLHELLRPSRGQVREREFEFS